MVPSAGLLDGEYSKLFRVAAEKLGCEAVDKSSLMVVWMLFVASFVGYPELVKLSYSCVHGPLLDEKGQSNVLQH